MFRYTISVAIFSLCLSLSNANAKLAGYYNFDETSGTVARDSAGGNDGTLYTGAQWSPDGKYGSALSLDGINGYVEVPVTNSYDFSKSFSVAVWVKPVNPPTGDMDIFTVTNGGTDGQNVVLRTYGNGRIRFSFYGANLDSSTGVFQFGQWSHLGVTFDATSDISTVYLNGQQILSGNIGSYSGGQAPVCFGKWNVGYQNQNHFEGLMDDLKIYDTALSAADMQAAMTPEPATCLLLGLGGLALRYRK
jgi:hypothetical protein